MLPSEFFINPNPDDINRRLEAGFVEYKGQLFIFNGVQNDRISASIINVLSSKAEIVPLKELSIPLLRGAFNVDGIVFRLERNPFIRSSSHALSGLNCRTAFYTGSGLIDCTEDNFYQRYEVLSNFNNNSKPYKNADAFFKGSLIGPFVYLFNTNNICTEFHQNKYPSVQAAKNSLEYWLNQENKTEEEFAVALHRDVVAPLRS